MINECQDPIIRKYKTSNDTNFGSNKNEVGPIKDYLGNKIMITSKFIRMEL